MTINHLFHSFTDTVVTWSAKRKRRISVWSSRLANGKRNTKKTVSFLARGFSFIPSFSHSSSSVGTKSFDSEEDDAEEIGVWQKKILMGEKCQPLDFSGIIYYDCAGRQVSECPMTPIRTPMASFAYRDADSAHELHPQSL